MDAHSFCWLLARLPEGSEDNSTGRRKDAGRILGAREKSIIEMRYTVENTVRYSNGQLVQRTVKNKELRMTPMEFEQHVAMLLDRQENRCAMTGIQLQYHGNVTDKNLSPSLDRIDSNGHYEIGNLQVVCRFINFWKSDTDNEEFKQLLALVRGMDEE